MADEDKKKKRADDGFVEDPGAVEPDPNNTGLNLDGEPNPPSIPPPPKYNPYPQVGGGPTLGGTDGTGSIAGFNPEGPNLYGTGGGRGTDGFLTAAMEGTGLRGDDPVFDGGGNGGGSPPPPPPPPPGGEPDPQLEGTDQDGNQDQSGEEEVPLEEGTYRATNLQLGELDGNITAAQIQSVDMPEFRSNIQRGANPLADRMDSYAMEFLENPTRYDMDVVKQAVDAIGQRMGIVRQDTSNEVKQYLAARGILGDTMGAELYSDTMTGLAAQEQEQLANLRREQAMTAGEDRYRSAAVGRDQAGFRESQYQFDSDQEIRERAQELQKYGIDSQTAIAQAQMEQRTREFNADFAIRERALDLQLAGLNQRDAQFQAQMEFNQMQQRQNEQYRRDVFSWDQDEANRNWLLELANAGMSPDDEYLRSMGLTDEEIRFFNSTGKLPG